MLDRPSNLEPGWTDDRIEQLKVLWTEGKSATEISMAIGGGLSRNAVIGKVHRLKLNLDRVKPAGQSNRPRRDGASRPKPVKLAPAVGMTRRDRIAKRKELDVQLEAEPIKTIDDVDIVGIQLVELTDKTCRWPLGDPREPGFRFCGLPPDAEHRYCPTHHRRSYRAPGVV